MHILLIHQAFVTPSEPGGSRHYELAKHLVQQGHRITVVTSDLSYLTGKPIAQAEESATRLDLPRLQVIRAYASRCLHRSFVWRVLSFASFMITSVVSALRVDRVDLVMGTSPPIFQALSAWLVAALRARPFLLEIRDLWPAFAIDMGVLKNPILIAMSRRLEQFLYARATHIIVNSPAYQSYLADHGVAPEKISLIPNGVDTKMFDPEAMDGAVRTQLGLNGHFVVTYAGALGIANDIPLILRAARQLQEDTSVHFLIVGDGMARPNLQSMAKDMGLPNVTFTGARPKSEMACILAASDACVATLQDIPMFRTTYPNKVFDYMAAGRPTILAIDGVIREVIEAARGGVFVPPGDETALVNAVRTLSRDRQRTRAMGSAAREYVLKHFDRERQAVQLGTLMACLCVKAHQ